MYVKIKPIELKKNKIIAKFECHPKLKKYFNSDTIFYEYSKNLKIPNSIASIPILSNFIHLSWALGFDIYIEEVDWDYYDSINNIKDIFNEWYPQFNFNSKIFYNRKIKNKKIKSNKYGLLFSGGLDSISAYISNKDKNIELYSLWGADIPIYEKGFWYKVRKSILTFSKEERLDNYFIKTNMRLILNEGDIIKKYNLSGWWGEVSHGLLIISSSIPLLYSNKTSHLIIGASHNNKFSLPWGSDPKIDEKIKVAGIQVIHEDYKYTRQEKIKFNLKNNQKYNKYLRVCWSNNKKFNCGKCEKCCRTIIGLILEDINPNECNFNFKKSDLYQIKRYFDKGIFRFTGGKIFIWNDLKKNIPKTIDKNIYYDKYFIKWLSQYDFSNYKMNRLNNRISGVLNQISNISYYRIRYLVDKYLVDKKSVNCKNTSYLFM